MSVLAGAFMAHLRKEAPGVRTVVRPLGPTALDDLEAGHCDLALMVRIAKRNFRMHELFREAFVCVMREDHPLSERALSLDLFCSLDHALVALDGSFEGRTDEALDAIGRKRRVVLSVGSFLILPAVLQATDMIAVIPARLAKATPGLAIRRPPLPIPGFSLYALWHESSHGDPARSWARSVLFGAAAFPSTLDGP